MNTQIQPFECGISCVAEIITRIHKVPSSLQALRDRHPALIKGATIGQLRELLLSYRVTSKAVRAEPEHLTNAQLPAILHWGHNHFVVMLKRGRRGAHLFDPAQGEVFVDNDQLNRMFTGVALVACAATAKLDIALDSNDEPQSFFKISHPRISLMLVLLLIGQLIAVLMPTQMQWVVDNLTTVNAPNNLYLGLTSFFLLGLLMIAANWCRDSLLMGIQIDLKERARTQAFHRLCQPLKKGVTALPSGEIITRMSSLAEIYRIGVQSSAMAFADLLFLLAVVILIFVYSPVLALVTGAAIMLTTLASVVMMSQIRVRANSDITAQSAIQSALGAWAVEGWAQRFLYSQTQSMNRWQGHCINQASTEFSVQKLTIALRLITGGIRVAEVAAMYWVLAASYTAGALSVGMITAVVAWRGMLAMRSDSLVRFYQELKMRDLYIARMCSALECHEPVDRVDQHVEFSGALRYHSTQPSSLTYSVRYPDSFELANGERMLVCGPSGVGKSYFLKAMMGVVSLDQGRFLYAGCTATEIKPDLLASAIGWVSSEMPAVNGVLLDVLDPGRASEPSQIMAWFDKLGLTEWFAQLPLGFYTVVGAGGVELSQGQMTKLSIIRALCKRPRYLLLDEPLAHLDAKSQRQVCDLLVCINVTQVWIHHGELPVAFDRVVRVRSDSRQISNTHAEGHDTASDCGTG